MHSLRHSGGLNKKEIKVEGVNVAADFVIKQDIWSTAAIKCNILPLHGVSRISCEFGAVQKLPAKPEKTVFGKT